ncbi:hypothetical protein FJV46_10715 [Arthrobacter agilis]|uniref:hypothetical protein n=1 Tax=Arthrobacter agilis TaxID=37921 RepID=UPI000B5863C5|nr:hypothetical protein [Arthrobacter agilis]OUM44152.1 hypothetical protein B8W74_04570 [Arthrobacter agilis]PPB46528.1 hypothetical protein CI784_06865 [Arthrobacter agilis]TPV23816.1 hypothetical protein FJV46_10715 [Arthrobacter agilis]VDR32551.1 Uncharacterised protein [Arthrobacter agilis]
MVTDLLHGDFELDGYVIGGDRDRPVYIKSFLPGRSDVRSQDFDNPVGDGRLFGRDAALGSTWSFSFGMASESSAASLAALNSLSAAWKYVHREPGAESVLRYKVGGRVRRVYGRARHFDYDPNYVFFTGYAVASGEFVTSDAVHYEDALRSVSVGLLAEVSGSQPLPSALPFTFAPGGPRSGIIQDVGGDAPAPVEVTFAGPVTGPSATIGGQLVALPGLTLAFDQSVTVNTRTMTVTRNDGASLAGALSRRTYLEDVRLQPGLSEVVYSGSDLTGTSRCTVAWRPAHYGF